VLKPVVGEYATSYLYSDRNVHYITKVEKDGKVFWTKRVQRCAIRPEFTATFRKDEAQINRITIRLQDCCPYIEDKIFLLNQVEKDFWLYLEEDDEDEDIRLDRWTLLKDGKYHESRYDGNVNKYRNSIKNTIITPNKYDYYYDPSF
jgi:hypothetical protein